MSHISYYVTGNTSNGLVNLLSTNIAGCKTIIILKHRSEKLKTTILQQIEGKCTANDEIELLKSEISKKYLQGIIIRNKSVAVLSDTALTVPPENAHVMNLNEWFPQFTIPEDDKEKIKMLTESAHVNFAAGLKVHDQLEKVYIKQMNFNQANELANQFISKLLANYISHSNNQPTIYKRLFGTNTADGVVNVVPEILERTTNCFFIKGRAGTGKSTFMKKVVRTCVEKGLNLELYYCSFDPDSLDMVRIPELDTLLFDSTNPHEFFPGKSTDVIIDFYKEFVKPMTDENFADEIAAITKQYKMYMKKGIIDLKNAGLYIDKNENTFDLLPEKVEEISVEIGKFL